MIDRLDLISGLIVDPREQQVRQPEVGLRRDDGLDRLADAPGVAAEHLVHGPAVRRYQLGTRQEGARAGEIAEKE